LHEVCKKPLEPYAGCIECSKQSYNRIIGSDLYYCFRHIGFQISGFQLLLTYSVREDASLRKAFAEKMAEAIVYWVDNYLPAKFN